MARSRTPPPPPSTPGEPPNLRAVAARLRALEKPDGQILESDVVADASDPSSPCHTYFEWDDTEAAHSHRLQQARQLIRRVKVIVTVHRIDIRAPKYVKDFKNLAGYRHVEMVAREEDTKRATLIYEMQRIVAAVNRAKATAHALGLEDEIKQLDELATGICRRISIDDDPLSPNPQ
jgi:hypothetical protein